MILNRRITFILIIKYCVYNIVGAFGVVGKTAAMQARGRWFKSLSRRIFVRTNNGWLVVSRQNLAVSRNQKRVRNEQRTVTLDGV